MTYWTVLKLMIITLLMHLLPGWALLSLGGSYKRWSVLQRWIIAFFLGMSFYPVFFYLARLFLPNLQLGRNKLILFLVLCVFFTIWQFRKNWRENFAFKTEDLVVAGLLVLTLISRLIPAWQYPYPAWTDSLHHSIITKSVMLNGQLPKTMLPLDPADLSGYHLGLYALTGSLGLLGNVAPHTALLYYAQIINAFCGLAVFILLDKKVGRLAGLAGMVFAGFISFQPALYFNWGRFTQLASQTLMLPSALISWEVFRSTSKKDLEKSKTGFDLASILLAGLTISATALLHFRVAAFFLPLLVLIFIFVIAKKGTQRAERKQIFLNTFLVAIVTILLTLPALIPALQSYLQPSRPIEELGKNILSSTERIPLIEHPYYKFGYPVFFDLGLTKAASIFVAIGLIIGLCFKKTRPLTLITIGWLCILFIEGNLALLNIPKLAFVNMTGVMILAYLPGAIGFAMLAESFQLILNRFDLPPAFPHHSLTKPALSWMLFFIALLFVRDRINTIESYRHFMTPEDHKAMAWIKENTPKDTIFGVNSMYWAGGAFHGTDAGYWIPYFAERDTSTRTMMSEDSPEYDLIRQRNALIYLLYFNEGEPIDTQPFCEVGIHYLYTGKKAPFTNMDFNLEALNTSPDVRLIYDQDNIQIFDLCSSTIDFVSIQD